MPKENINILLIDDNTDECSFFKEALQSVQVPFELTCCHDVLDEVYYHLTQREYHLIFLDINLPGENGIKFLKQIKEKDNYKKIPVVMYTVSSNEKDIDACFGLCAHRYMIKPYSHINLVETLRKIFAIDFTAPVAKQDFVINLAFA